MKKSLLILLFLTYSSFSIAEMPYERAPNQFDKIVENGFLIPLSTIESDLINILGKPKRVEESDVENKYYNFTDSIKTYKYEGLEISYYHHRHPETGWNKIVSIRVSNNQYKIMPGIRVGMKIDEIEKFLDGLPTYRSKKGDINNIHYQAPGSVHDQITFVVKSGGLYAFVWSNWP